MHFDCSRQESVFASFLYLTSWKFDQSEVLATAQSLQASFGILGIALGFESYAFPDINNIIEARRLFGDKQR